MCGRGGDTLVNTARTPLLAPHRQLPWGLSFTYALKRLPALCVTLARRNFFSKRVSPPVPSSYINGPTPRPHPSLSTTHLQLHRKSIRQRCSNIQHTSSSTASPIRPPWLPSRFSSLPRSPASLSPTITQLTVGCPGCIRFLVCAAQANMLVSRLYRPNHCDCHRDRVCHA